MPDISTVWTPGAADADWLAQGVDLTSGDDLETAVIVSLFTDRRADPDDVIPDGSGDPRGWWGDAGRDRPLGSKLWLLERAKQTEETRLRAKDYIEDALQWLVDEKIAASVEVEVRWQRAGMLAARVVLREPDQRLEREFTYQWAWKGLN